MHMTADRRTNLTGYATHHDAATSEWGPAKHNPQHPLHREADLRDLRFDQRDGDDLRPDDN